MKIPEISGISVRLKLILTSLVLIAALLLLLGYIAHQWQKTSETAKIDTFLNADAGATAAVITTYLPDKPLDNAELAAFVASSQFIGNLKDYLHNRLNRPAVYKTTLGIYNTTGGELVASNDALPIEPKELQSPEAKFSDQTALPDHTQIATVTIGHLVFRIIILPVHFQDDSIAIIRLACLLAPALEATSDFDRSLVSILSIIGLFAGLGSVFLITRTLQPVNSMRLAADRITERNLNYRIPVTPGQDEISKLSRTFNHLLARIEGAYRYQVQLVEDLSHQLKTPLTILRSSIDLALRSTYDRKNYHQVLEDSLEDIDRLSSFLITILGLARLESKSVSLNLKRTDLVMLISEMVADMEPLWMQNQLHFSFSIQRGDKSYQIPIFPITKNSRAAQDLFSCPVMIDPPMLNQAFMNILSNAFKYCPLGGEIEILLEEQHRQAPEMCRIVFFNTGPTIPSEDLDNIFERFYTRKPISPDSHLSEIRQTSQENLHTKGFGLGLSIARNIVELHGGKIRALQLAKPGAAFEILIPNGHTAAPGTG